MLRFRLKWNRRLVRERDSLGNDGEMKEPTVYMMQRKSRKYFLQRRFGSGDLCARWFRAC